MLPDQTGRQTATDHLYNAGRWIGHANPSMSLRAACQLRDVEAGVGAQAILHLSLAIVTFVNDAASE